MRLNLLPYIFSENNYLLPLYFSLNLIGIVFHNTYVFYNSTHFCIQGGTLYI